MRRRNLANLLYYFHRSAGRFNGCLGFVADRVHLENDLGFQFPVAQDLHPVCLADQPVDIEILEGELADIVFTGQLFSLPDIEHFVFHPVGVLETALGGPALDRHLAAFMGHFPFITGAALSALVSFCGSASVSGSFTAA